MSTFTTQINAAIAKYKVRMDVTAKSAVQETVRLAQRIEKEGGRMLVDTGFLRASIQGSTGSMPTGVSINPDPKGEGETIEYNGGDVAASIIKWQPGLETLYIGWTANYARPREYKDGFLRGAVEQWDGTVNLVANRIKQRI